MAVATTDEPGASPQPVAVRLAGRGLTVNDLAQAIQGQEQTPGGDELLCHERDGEQTEDGEDRPEDAAWRPVAVPQGAVARPRSGVGRGSVRVGERRSVGVESRTHTSTDDDRGLK